MLGIIYYAKACSVTGIVLYVKCQHKALKLANLLLYLLTGTTKGQGFCAMVLLRQDLHHHRPVFGPRVLHPLDGVLQVVPHRTPGALVRPHW